MEIKKCPVCLGNGLVSNGYYNATRQEEGYLLWTSGSTEPEICRSCNGKGYVIIDEVNEER